MISGILEEAEKSTEWLGGGSSRGWWRHDSDGLGIWHVI